MPADGVPIPLVQPGARARRDAAANSQRILCAARDLVAELGTESVTMDAVAAAACVGKGTVFRAYGSRAGLMGALLDETEREFQAACMFGPPPLGPGASPRERLLAFGEGRLRLDRLHGELLRAMAHGPGARFGSPPRQVAALHVRSLLRAAGIHEGLEVLTEALLAPLDPDAVQHLRDDRGLRLDDVVAGWRQLVIRLLD